MGSFWFLINFCKNLVFLVFIYIYWNEGRFYISFLVDFRINKVVKLLEISNIFDIFIL